MKEADITLHFMCRDEFPTCVFSLLSTLPFAKKAIIVDTGSTDGTREWLQKIKDIYSDKISLQLRDDVPDSSQWSFHRYITPNRYLSEIRDKMIRETTTEFFWIVDGDEVYRNITCEQIVESIETWPKDKLVMYVPLLWFAKDINTLGCFSPASYGLTGRVFKMQGIKMHGHFPGEMHTGPNGEDLGPASELAILAKHMEPYMHYEMVTKPWRRKITGTAAYNGPIPEVFFQYGIWPDKKAEKVLYQRTFGVWPEDEEKKSEEQNSCGYSHTRMGEDRVSATVGGRVLERSAGGC